MTQNRLSTIESFIEQYRQLAEPPTNHNHDGYRKESTTVGLSIERTAYWSWIQNGVQFTVSVKAEFRGVKNA